MPLTPFFGKRLLQSLRSGLPPMQILNMACLAALLPPAWCPALYPLWIGNLIATILVNLFLLRRLLLGIPKDLQDAARIDGCGFWRAYWHVALPLARPALAFIGLFFLIAACDDVAAPLLEGSCQPLHPLSPGILMDPGRFGIAMAVCLLFITPAISTLLFARRYFLKEGTLAA